MNLPNALTTLRILLIPFFVFFYYLSSVVGAFIAALIFIAASITDVLDGYLARRRSEVTRIGQLLDPIADKLLIVSALVLLVENKRVPSWMAIIIIGREFAMTGMRAIASSRGIVIGAERAGKYKMFLQIIAILLLIIDTASDPWNRTLRQVGLLLLGGAMLLAIFSAGQYVTKYGRIALSKE